MAGDDIRDCAWVVVLNDDETYANLDGCWIAPLNKEQEKALDEGEISVRDLPKRLLLTDLLMAAEKLDD